VNHLGEGARIALRALWSNKLRTVLTLLGNIVAVTSVVAVVSLLDGMDGYIRHEILDEGSSVFHVRQRDDLDVFRSFDAYLASLHNPPLRLADADYLRHALPGDWIVGADASWPARFEFAGRAVDGVLRGRSASYPALVNFQLDRGRDFTALEEDHSRPVAVIGWDVARTLFPQREALGQWIRISGQRFQVIAVAEDRGSVFGQSQNLFAFVPVTTALKRFHPRPSIAIPVKTPTLEEVPAAMERTRFAMRVHHRLRPGDAEDFAVTSSAQLLSLWERISRSIFAALVGIVSISLVVGGIIIMNVMLVSVSERTAEIGLRKAVGASRGKVLWQFLVEAVTLSLVGGLLGILLGFGAASLISLATPLPYTVKPWSFATALVVTAAVGIFFGLYPASRAARLDPIEALRHG
jgi:putative ABC transport system permease protein